MIWNRKSKQPILMQAPQPEHADPQNEYGYVSDEHQYYQPTEDQIEIPLKNSKLNIFYNLKRRFTSTGQVLEALPFWKNINTVLAVLSSLTIVIAMFYTVSTNFDKLPDKIPLIYKQASSSWELVDKEILLPIPIFLAAMLVLLVNFSSNVYRFDRRLSFMINIAIIVFNLIGLVAFYQILSLILIY